MPGGAGGAALIAQKGKVYMVTSKRPFHFFLKKNKVKELQIKGFIFTFY